MGFITGASALASLASAGLGIAKAVGGSGAQSQATNAQLDANNSAIALNQPYSAAGASALNQINQFLTPGFDATSAIEQTPGYQFQYQQGLDAGNRAAAAAGTLNSGGTIKAQTRYGQNYAQNAYQNQLNNLFNVTKLGTLANSNIDTNLLNIGGIKAQNAVNQNGIIQNGLGGLANIFSNGSGGSSGGSGNFFGAGTPANFNVDGPTFGPVSFGGI